MAVIGVVSGKPEVLCGGSILSETKVITAAHCMFGGGTQIAAEQIHVVAGTADIEVAEPEEEETIASAVKLDPYYSHSAPLPAPDDVAILTLKTALHLDAAVQPIALVTPGTIEPEGAAVNLTGFGEEEPESELEPFTGKLNSLALHVGFSRVCGGEEDAVFVCASAAGGSPCHGDSGSGLTLPGSPPSLLGVTNTIQGEGAPCGPGSIGGFANLAAPEIADFVAGIASPPLAPRGGGALIRGVIVSGQALTCEPGFWSGAPTFSFRFIDTGSGQILQQGTSRMYLLGSGDVGRKIDCEVLAANPGGTGVGRTPPLGPIVANAQEEEARKRAEEEAAARKRAEEVQNFGVAHPTPDAQLASTSLKANKQGIVTLEISCPAGESACAGSVVLRTSNAVAASRAGTARHRAVLTLAEASFSVKGGTTGTVRLHLSARARKLLARKGTLQVRVTITAHDAAGATHAAVAVVTLHAPPRR